MNRSHLLQVNSKNPFPLPDKSVHQIVTSPPYYAQRDYGFEEQIGQEKTPEEFIESLMVVFRECWRVLRDDGTLWVNIADTYMGSGGQHKPHHAGKHEYRFGATENKGNGPMGTQRKIAGYKNKDIVGIPWMLAFALRSEGWFLRAPIIWYKANMMPETAKDRPTRDYENIFLLSKSRFYFYDWFNMMEPVTGNTHSKGVKLDPPKKNEGRHIGWDKSTAGIPDMRMGRTVWKIKAKPYKGAHFATFPPALPEKCIKGGSSEKGVCPECGAPWVRIVESGGGALGEGWNDHKEDTVVGNRGNSKMKGGNGYYRKTVGWEPSCDCCEICNTFMSIHDHVPYDPVPATILDPFGGSGTTAQVADNMGRRGIAFELSWKYLQTARKRLNLEDLELWESGKGINGDSDLDDLPLFKDMQEKQ